MVDLSGVDTLPLPTPGHGLYEAKIHSTTAQYFARARLLHYYICKRPSYGFLWESGGSS